MSFDLDGFLPYRLSVAASRISRRFAALYGAEAGLSIPEWRVLAHLDRSGAVSVRDINARVHLDKSIVSRAASRLEEAGLLRKSGHDTDRRLVTLELTAEGQAVRKELDSLIAVPKKSRADSVRIVRHYKKLENIVKSLKNNDNS